MTRTAFERVAEFHRQFGHPVERQPVVPDGDRARLRAILIVEETIEVIGAMFENGVASPNVSEAMRTMKTALALLKNAEPFEFAAVNLPEFAKELADLEYVTCGAALEFGIDLDFVMKAVHASNLSKLGEDGKPIYNEHGKVVKGPHYKAPDIKALLQEQLELDV